ncbi:MAG: hypothetical protein ACOVP1_02180 [Bacteroidia bacterium]
MQVKAFISALLIIIFSIQVNARTRGGNTYRLGVGSGYTYYLGNQMDYEITSGFGNFNENRVGQNLGFYKALNNQWELGGFVRNTSMLTLKSENTQGVECIFQDAQFTAQHSFNDNIELSGSPITFNATLGLGFIYFQSRYFTVDPVTAKEIQNFSTIGYGYADGFDGQKHDPSKRIAVTGHAGFNIGIRITKNINIYQENNFNLTTSNMLSGNLYKRSWIPTDGYWYSGLALYIRWGNKADACPRFY